MPSITAAKQALRAQARRCAAGLSPEERRRSDRLLAERFLALPQVEAAGTLLLFYGVGSEIETRPLLDALLARGKGVYLPKCLPGRAMEARRYEAGLLREGAFGIPEPGEDCPALQRDRIELILVPALCYDRSLFRLGQGGGYYDRYLAGYEGRTVGLCRACMLLGEVPHEEHDAAVECVLTEGECLSR